MPLEQVPDINFKTEELQASYKETPLIEWVNKVGKNILIATQTIILILLGLNFFFSRSLNNLKSEYDSLKQRTESVENLALLKSFRELQLQVLEIENIENSSINWTQRLNLLREKIPADLLVEEYEYKSSTLNIKATVKSVQGFALFISKLQADETIRSISLNNSTYNTETKDFNFEMELTL